MRRKEGIYGHIDALKAKHAERRASKFAERNMGTLATLAAQENTARNEAEMYLKSHEPSVERVVSARVGGGVFVRDPATLEAIVNVENRALEDKLSRQLSADRIKTNGEILQEEKEEIDGTATDMIHEMTRLGPSAHSDNPEAVIAEISGNLHASWAERHPEAFGRRRDLSLEEQMSYVTEYARAAEIVGYQDPRLQNIEFGQNPVE